MSTMRRFIPMTDYGVRPVPFDGVTNPYAVRDGSSLFRRSYPVVRSYVTGNPASLFANARQSGRMPIVSKRAREWLPGVFTFDHEHLEFARAFTKELESLKPEFDDEGFSLNGLHATFDSVRTVAGYPQSPVSALPRNNAAVRQDLGLQESMAPKQRRIAEELLDRIFRRMYPKAIRVPKNSTSGPVRNVSDEVYKLHYGLYVFSSSRYDSYLSSFASGDLNSFVRDWDACVMFGTNVRWQVDTPGKRREYWDIRDVLKTDAPHKRPITTEVVIDGMVYSDFAAMRTRMINQGPWTVNVMLQPFATGWMQTMFKDYPETWYPDETQFDSLFEGKHIWAGDVSSYDHSFSKEQIDLTIEMMGRYTDERVCKLARQLYYAAYFTRPIGDPKDGFRPAVVGDPLRYLEDQVVAGNRSGHAFTSIMAKLWKVIDTLCKFDAIGVNVLENMDNILRGRFHCGMLNNGDDEIVWFTDESLKLRFTKYIGNIDRSQKMFDVEFEKGCVYSGNVFQRVGPTSYKTIERIPGTFERMMCPERSIGGRMRPMWPIGILERYNRRTEHDLKEEAFRIFDSTFRRYMEPRYGSFHSLVEYGMKTMPVDTGGLTWIDKQVLEDPAKIHYRFKPEDVSEEILEMTFSKLQPDVFIDYLKHCYTGAIEL
nr:MAG: putative RNA-dependent RNA polymerase [Guangxi cystovirus 9]